MKIIYAIFCIFVLQVGIVLAEIRLPKHISGGMVIQRNANVIIRGWADPGEKIKLRFKGKNYSSTTDSDGQWSITLSPSKAGGPFTMEIKGKEDAITIDDILIGDVWVCSGQSNMVHYLGRHQDRYKDEIANANYPEIRQFLVSTNPQLTGPAEDVSQGDWKEANSENVLQFSVVAYFFAKKLYDKYRVPIGLINSSVGGTPIEAWTSEEGLKNFPHFKETIEQNKDTSYVNEINQNARLKRRELNSKQPEDKGLVSSTPWYDPEYEIKNWDRMNIPGYWEDQGIRDLNGSVWFRRTFEIPAHMTGRPGRIYMGRIVDADHIYINGELVGNITYQYPQRRYDFDADILKTGKNTIVIRVQNYAGKGGFVPDKPYYLATDTDTLDLKGYWQYKVGAVYVPQEEVITGISEQNQPSALYNGMIAPFTDFPITGWIWYQGESNAGRPHEYEKLMPAIIHDWRNQWGNPTLPFIYAQLPNFMEVNYLPEDTNWANLREAQRKALKVPHTAMIVTLNLGEWNDIHPGNKKPIGDRMALAAQKLAYGEDVVYSGPLYSSFTVHKNKVVLHFEHIGSGLISNDGEPLRWFAIAGEDQNFMWAHAEIQDNQVIVWHEDIKNPKFIRYAWADNPDKVNLFNLEGLPASPFEVKLK